jgi:polyphenol oxidase
MFNPRVSDMVLPQPSESFFWTQDAGGPALRCRPLLAVAPHLFTTRAISVGRTPGDRALAAVAASLGMTPQQVVQVHQVHGRDIVEVRAGEPTTAGDADVLISSDPERAVGVRIADCLAVLLADDTGRTVAAVHAGWRGVARRAALAAVMRMQERFGVRPARLIAAVGPSIGACCYEVGEEVRAAFRAEGHADPLLDQWFVSAADGKLRLDLWRAIRDQLEGAGLMPGHIFQSGLCTACHPGAFHSYRRDGIRAGRLAGVIRCSDDRRSTDR